MAPNNQRPGIHEVQRSSARPRVAPPRVLDHIQNIALDNAVQLLDHMFSAADDLFYDLSKRASTNNEENLYFESMREIRIKKQGVANEFLRALTNEFNDLVTGQSQAKLNRTDGDITSGSLSIVEGDDLEIELALNNMTGRTREIYKEELYELAIRLDHLLLQVTVNENTNPLDPQQVGQAFISACLKQLNVGIKIRLILFKLFEKHVLKQLGHIYTDANQVLIDSGILPKVPRNLNKGESGGHSASAQPEAPEANPQAQQHATANAEAQRVSAPQINFTLDINSLNTLMSAARASQANMFATTGQNSGSNYTYYLYSSNPGPAMAAMELSALLTKSQPVIDRQLTTRKPTNVVSDVVNQLLSKRDPKAPQALDQTSEDVINLVAMFFDNILEDDNLPIAIQSLICRLQIPVLKVALRDQNFLTDSEHPARKLINTITEAGLGLDESKPLERDPLYRKIVDGVQTVNRLFKVDTCVFTEVNNDIEEMVKKEASRARVVEKRTTQAEAGKNRIKLARAAAQGALYDKMRDATLPDVVSSFLTNTWLQVLIITYLKHGQGSSDWIEMEQLVADVIWLCKQHTDERSRQRKTRLQPDILQRIETGLAAAIDAEDTRQQKIAEIERAVVALDSAPAEKLHYRTLDEQQKIALGKTANEEKAWEDMSALERQQSKYQELSSKYYQIAKNIPEGTWLNYFDEETGRQLRCKLSAKLDSDSYIFVNRLGLKALEKSRRQFAYDMQFNKAKTLDVRPIFERVMQSVVSRLKQAA